ncbi:MAG: efflux RND transporter periplasmic adaptor subunit [Pseudomonadota bacterium]
MNLSFVKRNGLLLLMGILLVGVGVVAGWWQGAQHAVTQDATIAASQAERQILYWYDPMAPQQHFDKPGKSPYMDMELTPKYADEDTQDVASGGGAVKINPDLTQNLGVRLASVARIPLVTHIEASGLIGFNDRDVAVIQTRSSGFVERVQPLAPGDVVHAGQALLELAVPEWTSAQHELLAVKASGDTALIAATRERLRLMGMPDDAIKGVEQGGVPRASFAITAPIAGVIQTLDVRAGMTVASGQTIARINGLSTVWLEVAVPENIASAVRPGVGASVRLPTVSAQPVRGRVTAVLPALNEVTRSLRVRVELPNPAGRLRPGLSAQVTLSGAAERSALAVPTEAVIRTGKRALVVRAIDNGKFIPQEVTLGQEVGDQTVIVAGLTEGQKVVASGQFLIDSEASLQGLEARMEKLGAGR